MAARLNPKTLAKTINYISYFAPGEHGLFWDTDGTMPWKELHWALQQDPSLKFVRESHLRELVMLGMELPFVLDGRLLRLKKELRPPDYHAIKDPPTRLYYACRPKHYPQIQTDGLYSNSRSFVPLTAEKHMAILLAKRRDSSPVLIDVMAVEAVNDGYEILSAGGGLYLTKNLPSRYLQFPLLPAKQTASTSATKLKATKLVKPENHVLAGSFVLDSDHLNRIVFPGTSSERKGKEKNRGGKSGDWKRESRKERFKRNI